MPCSKTVLKSMALPTTVRDWSVCNGIDSTKSGREDSETVSEVEDRKKKPSKSERTFQQTKSVCQCTGVCSNPNNFLIINNNYQNSSKNLHQKSSNHALKCSQKQWRNGIFTQISIPLLSSCWTKTSQQLIMIHNLLLPIGSMNKGSFTSHR